MCVLWETWRQTLASESDSFIKTKSSLVFPYILPTLASVPLNISVSSDLYLDQESSNHLSTKWICIRAMVKMSSGELLDRGEQPIGPVPAILGHPLPRVSSYSPFPRWELEPRCLCKSLYQKITIGNVCCLGKPLCEMCWFYMGIAQIALDPPHPLCQTGKRFTLPTPSPLRNQISTKKR